MFREYLVLSQIKYSENKVSLETCLSCVPTTCKPIQFDKTVGSTQHVNKHHLECTPVPFAIRVVFDANVLRPSKGDTVRYPFTDSCFAVGPTNATLCEFVFVFSSVFFFKTDTLSFITVVAVCVNHKNINTPLHQRSDHILRHTSRWLYIFCRLRGTGQVW